MKELEKYRSTNIAILVLQLSPCTQLRFLHKMAAAEPQDHGWNQGEKELPLLSPKYLGSATANRTVAVLTCISLP